MNAGHLLLPTREEIATRRYVTNSYDEAMRRAAFNLLAFLSLLVFIAAGVFWVRGQFVSDFVYRARVDGTAGVQTTRTGVILFDLGWHADDQGPDRYSREWLTASEEPISIINDYPIQFDVTQSRINVLHVVVNTTPALDTVLASIVVMHIPYWLVMLLSVPLPAFWLARRHRSPARRLGLCVKCGYDLRGTAVDTACPECGRARV